MDEKTILDEITTDIPAEPQPKVVDEATPVNATKTAIPAADNEPAEVAKPSPAFTEFQQLPPQQVNPSDLLGNAPIAEPAPAAQPSVDPATGEPIKRGRGRPPGAKNRSVSQIVEGAEQVNQVDYALMSGALFDMSTGALSTMFGPEWQPKSAQEREHVIMPLMHYLKSKQVQDIPPGMMLTIIICAYAAPRLREPSTASKLSAMWVWLKSKIIRKKKVIAP